MNVTAPSFDDIVDDTAWLFHITATCALVEEEPLSDRLPEVDVVNPSYTSVIAAPSLLAVQAQPKLTAVAAQPAASSALSASRATSSVSPAPGKSISNKLASEASTTNVTDSRGSPGKSQPSPPISRQLKAKPDYETKKQLAQLAIADTDASKVRRPNRYR